MPISTQTLFQELLQAKICTKKEIASMQKLVDQEQKDPYTAFVKIKDLSAKKADALIAKAFEVKSVDLSKQKIDKKATLLIPEITSKKLHLLAFDQDKKGLHVATDDPANERMFTNLQNKLGVQIIPYFANTDAITSQLRKIHDSETESFSDLVGPILKGEEMPEHPEDLPVVRIVDGLLNLGHKNKASDIHIEPHEEDTLIRFRIDGILHDIVKIPKKLHELVVMRIKILSRMRTDEHRSAQDGKLQFDMDGEQIDVRVSIVPIVRGEKIVLRILSEQSEQNDLNNLGLRPEQQEIVEHAIDMPWGMILSTGPTGSGKTTSLYSIIKRLNTREINISTIEDPVEYDIDGINQIQVNKKTNLTFSNGLRAIVRQDPDIIMVGEIRDSETAKIAINSAMTGHLVLSTLHTNDAATSLPRLADMGVEPFLIASTVSVVIAQRLVRKLCEDCKKEVALDKELIGVIEMELSEQIIKTYKLDTLKTKVWVPGGCAKCQQTGYKGRTGIFEILKMTDEIKELITKKANAEQVRVAATQSGMKTMIEDGIVKVLDGITSFDEVFRVIKE